MKKIISLALAMGILLSGCAKQVYAPPDYSVHTDAIRQADKAGVFVLTTSTGEFYDFNLFGMNRDYLGDPDDIQSYLPAGWIADSFYANPERFSDMYLVPMGSRTYASFVGPQEYEIGREGGLSWAVPWCAGFYALCCQVKPDLTPKEFIAAVKETAVTADIEHDGKAYPLKNIVDPAAVIALLQRR